MEFPDGFLAGSMLPQIPTSTQAALDMDVTPADFKTGDP